MGLFLEPRENKAIFDLTRANMTTLGLHRLAPLPARIRARLPDRGAAVRSLPVGRPHIRPPHLVVYLL